MDFEFTEEQVAQMPPVRHPLVRTNPLTGHRSLLIGAHAERIEGWPEDESRALLDELETIATRDAFRYRHRWQQYDLVIWDNRSVLHRATPFDAVNIDDGFIGRRVERHAELLVSPGNTVQCVRDHNHSLAGVRVNFEHQIVRRAHTGQQHIV